jgi:hypothetical protein
MSDEPEMRKIKWSVSMSLVGCRRSGEIEVEADCSDKEIDDMVREEVMQQIEWGWDDA